MTFLSFLKGMKIEDNCPIDVVFRTSRGCSALGFAFILAGLCMAWQIVAGHRLLCFFSFVKLGSICAAVALAAIGGMIMTYRKNVVISKRDKKSNSRRTDCSFTSRLPATSWISCRSKSVPRPNAC